MDEKSSWSSLEPIINTEPKNFGNDVPIGTIVELGLSPIANVQRHVTLFHEFRIE